MSELIKFYYQIDPSNKIFAINIENFTQDNLEAAIPDLLEQKEDSNKTSNEMSYHSLLPAAQPVLLNFIGTEASTTQNLWSDPKAVKANFQSSLFETQTNTSSATQVQSSQTQDLWSSTQSEFLNVNKDLWSNVPSLWTDSKALLSNSENLLNSIQSETSFTHKADLPNLQNLWSNNQLEQLNINKDLWSNTQTLMTNSQTQLPESLKVDLPDNQDLWSNLKIETPNTLVLDSQAEYNSIFSLHNQPNIYIGK